MKIKMNYTINDFNDSYILAGESLEEIQANNQKEMDKRGLSKKKNEMYSELIF